MRMRLILAILSFIGSTSFLLSQTATGVIRGTVQDRTGAVIPAVHVKLVDETRSQSWEEATNEEGFFEFRSLPFGNYTVEVDHPRFKKELMKNVVLQVAQTESLRVTLQLGSVKESIVVQAAPG